MIKLWISFSVCSPYSQNTPHAECLHISSLFSWNSIVLSYCLYQSAKVQKEKLIKQKCVCIYIYSISLVNLQQWNSWIMNVFAKLLAAELLINVWTIRQFSSLGSCEQRKVFLSHLCPVALRWAGWWSSWTGTRLRMTLGLSQHMSSQRQPVHCRPLLILQPQVRLILLSV